LEKEDNGIKEEEMCFGRRICLSNEIKDNHPSFRCTFDRMRPDTSKVEKHQHEVPEPQRSTRVNISRFRALELGEYTTDEAQQ